MTTRFTALLVTVLTGFSGLVYEVTWQKYLASLLGSHAEATAAVLAIFLGGLSAGYALFGRVTQRLVARTRVSSRPARLLFIYGLVEIGIGLYAALFPTFFGLAQHVSLVLAGHPGLGFAFDIGLSTLLIGPPTVLMGGTIPILTLALAGSLEGATRVHAWVYGFNTIGAFAGALAAAFVLVPTLGLDGTLFAMACVNILGGAIFLLLDRNAMQVVPDLATPAPDAAVPRLAGYAWVALLAGFAMMTIQTTINRVGALALGSSPFTFAMVVAVFVFSIALGSLLVSALPRISKGLLDGSQWALVALLFALYIQLEDAPYWAHVVRSNFQHHDGAFYPFQSFLFFSLLSVLILPIGLSGALLPLIFHQMRREVGELGSVAGRLYAWNTAGSLLGALLGGYILFFWLDLHEVFRVALAALVLGASILSAKVWGRSLPYMAGVVVLPVWVALVALPAWDPERLTIGLFRQRDAGAIRRVGFDETIRRGPGYQSDIVFYDDGPTSTVSVVHLPDFHAVPSHSIVVNGKSDGNLIGDFTTMALSALLPALMADSHERCFVIGFGTGVTAGELAALEGTREVDVAEISRGVIEAAPLFDYGNQGASRNPKVKIRRGDAFRTLLKSEGRYDVIISEPSNPWVTGVEMLFTQDFLEAARSRLSPGGVYAQWFHQYETDRETVRIVLRTYRSVFPHVSVWFTQGHDLLLLGFNDAQRPLDVRALEERFDRPDFKAAFERAEIMTFAELLAHELLPLGTVHAAEDPGEIHTLRNPILSDHAARAFFRGEAARLPRLVDLASTTISAHNSLLRRHSGVGPQDALPEAILEAAFYETCGHKLRDECAALMASWMYHYPNSQARERAAAKLRDLPKEWPQVTRKMVEPLVPLFGGTARRKQVTPELAQRWTSAYIQYFHHAVPFDLNVVADRWNRCTGSVCDRARERLAKRLGIALVAEDESTSDPAEARRAE